MNDDVIAEYFRRKAVERWADLREEGEEAAKRRETEEILGLTPIQMYEEAVKLAVSRIAKPPTAVVGPWRIYGEAWLDFPEPTRQYVLASFEAMEAVASASRRNNSLPQVQTIAIDSTDAE